MMAERIVEFGNKVGRLRKQVAPESSAAPEKPSRFFLDIDKVFGDKVTYSAVATIRLVGLPLAEVGENGGWMQKVAFHGGLDEEWLPKTCPPVGQVFLIFSAEGRVDRFRVIREGVVRCYLAPDGKKKGTYRDFRYRSQFVGRVQSWEDEDGNRLRKAWDAPIMRLVRIYRGLRED